MSLASDPYTMFLSYGHITHLKYHLSDPANVTVTVKDPVTGAQSVILSSEPQAAGDQEVVWDGLIGAGQLTADEGHYTFTVTATDAATGHSSSARGNITVYK